MPWAFFTFLVTTSIEILRKDGFKDVEEYN